MERAVADCWSGVEDGAGSFYGRDAKVAIYQRMRKRKKKDGDDDDDDVATALEAHQPQLLINKPRGNRIVVGEKMNKIAYRGS